MYAGNRPRSRGPGRGAWPAQRAENWLAGAARGCARANTDGASKQCSLSAWLAPAPSEQASLTNAFVTAPSQAARGLMLTSKKIARTGEVHCCAT
jgi:hypothetical protein